MSELSFIPDNCLALLGNKLSSSKLSGALGKLSDDFGDAEFLAKNYIQPHGQLEKPTDDDSSARRPVFGMLNEFLGVGGCDEGRRNCLFLLGDAGVGKTSLLLILKLTHLSGLWPSHYDCELLKLGASTLETIGNIKAPRKTVLLLDALNEDPTNSEGVFGRVLEILRAASEFHRVIVSCRAAYFLNSRRDSFRHLGDFASGGLHCATVFLSLFNHTQTDKYLKRRFQRMKEPNRKRAKSILNEMATLKGRPLLLNHIDDFVHSRRKSWDECSTYDALVDAWLEREQRRTDSKTTFNKASALEACVKMAQLMQMSDSRRSLAPTRLSESHLQELEIGLIESFDCQGRSLLRKDSAKAYRFTHASIQEFLVAQGVKNGVLPSAKKRIPATDLIIAFLLLCDDAATHWRVLDLTGVSFADATLHGADFSKTVLTSVSFVGSVFLKANFDHAQLKSCEAQGAKFSSCSFESAKAANASMRFTDFSGSRFAHTTLAGSVLSQANFDGCQIDHTLFADTNLCSTTFIKATINDCSFKSASLCAAEFTDTSLAKARFDHCNLKGATFNNNTLHEVSIQSADMRETNLDNTFLNAVKTGAVQNWKTAAWDPAIATALKLPLKENDRNVEAIDSRRGH